MFEKPQRKGTSYSNKSYGILIGDPASQDRVKNIIYGDYSPPFEISEIFDNRELDQGSISFTIYENCIPESEAMKDASVEIGTLTLTIPAGLTGITSIEVILNLINYQSLFVVARNPVSGESIEVLIPL